MKSQTLFSEQDKKAIIDAIKEAELNTSGEIRVHIEAYCKEPNVLDRAANVFAKLDMHKTEHRNGVLFYLATHDKRFAIIGDVGINRKVPSNFWEDVKEEMKQNFRSGKFTEGLCSGIISAGDHLKAHFPRAKNDQNELPDEISFGNTSE